MTGQSPIVDAQKKPNSRQSDARAPATPTKLDDLMHVPMLNIDGHMINPFDANSY